MEALPATDLPVGAEWQYEPKWDGFRCLAFRDRNRIDLMSKSTKPLSRYFPEMVAALSSLAAKQFVLDGEIVVVLGKALSFDHLLMRIHPAASRIQKLSEMTPATFMVFDLLVDYGGEPLVKASLGARREKIELFAKRFLRSNSAIRLSPVTQDQWATAITGVTFLIWWT